MDTLEGISVHIGSQIVSLDPFRRALRRLAGYIGELRKEGIALNIWTLAADSACATRPKNLIA